MEFSRAFLLCVALAACNEASAKPVRHSEPRRTYSIFLRPGNRVDYPSWEACQRAIAVIQSQFDPTPRQYPNGAVVIPAAPPTLYCVPR